jgi:hypothetical protein
MKFELAGPAEESLLSVSESVIGKFFDLEAVSRLLWEAENTYYNDSATIL